MSEMSFERPKATEIPEWQKWKVEGRADGEATLYAPDGSEYSLKSNERFVLIPSSPEGAVLPQPHIERDGKLMSLDSWLAATKTPQV